MKALALIVLLLPVCASAQEDSHITPDAFVAVPAGNNCWWCVLTELRPEEFGVGWRLDIIPYRHRTPFTRGQFTKTLTNCSVCDNGNLDWRRYRNFAWNNFLTAGDLANERRMPSDHWINFEVWGHRNGQAHPYVSRTHIVLVSIRFRYTEPLADVNFPLITIRGRSYQVDHVEVWVKTPSGDSHRTDFGWPSDFASTSPSVLPYPPLPPPRTPPPRCTRPECRDPNGGA